MWSVTGRDFAYEDSQVIGFHQHFLIIHIQIHGLFLWLRFGGVLIHVAKKTPDQHYRTQGSGSEKKTHRPHPNPEKVSLRVFHPSVRHGNDSTNSRIWRLRASVTSRLSGAKVQGRVLRATQLLETPSLLGMPNQKMTVTLGMVLRGFQWISARHEDLSKFLKNNKFGNLQSKHLVSENDHQILCQASSHLLGTATTYFRGLRYVPKKISKVICQTLSSLLLPSDFTKIISRRKSQDILFHWILTTPFRETKVSPTFPKIKSHLSTFKTFRNLAK